MSNAEDHSRPYPSVGAPPVNDSAELLPSNHALQDCVQVGEYDDDIHVNIGGRTKEMEQIYGSLYEQVMALEDKTVAELRTLLTKSQITPPKTRPSKGSDIDAEPQSPSTPLKGSSSTPGKSLTGPKAQPTDDQWISAEIVTDSIVPCEKNCHKKLKTDKSYLDPMLTSKASPASKSTAECTTKEQLIVTKQQSTTTTTTEQSNESAIAVCQTVSSTSSTMMMTRFRISQAKTNANDINMMRSSASKTSTVSKSVLKSCKSVSKSITTTRSKTKQQQPNYNNKISTVAASSKSLSKAKTAPLNPRQSASSVSSLNVGSIRRNLVPDHGRSSVGTGTLKKVGSLSKCTSFATKPKTTTRGPTTQPPNGTPKRVPARVPFSSAQPSTPSTVAQQQRRNRELESARYEQLALSVDKRKKAEDNKKALLDQRINALKVEREKRLEKIRENKFALENEKNKKRKAGEAIGGQHSAVTVKTVAPPQTPTVTNMTKAEVRNVERRRKLAQLQLEHDTKKTGTITSEPVKASNAAVKKVYSKPKSAPKNAHPNKNADEKQLPPQEEEQKVPGHSEMKKKIHHEGTAPKCTPKLDSDGAIANVPTADTPPLVTPSHLSATIKAKLLNECSNTYEMTPPPRERVCDPNLDITKYIEQDYEAEAAYEAAKDGKQIPKWAQGKEFARLVEEQFSMPPEQLNQWASRIFSGPVLPVPLEEMGLGVAKVRHAQRTTPIQAQKQ